MCPFNEREYLSRHFLIPTSWPLRFVQYTESQAHWCFWEKKQKHLAILLGVNVTLKMWWWVVNNVTFSTIWGIKFGHYNWITWRFTPWRHSIHQFSFKVGPKEKTVISSRVIIPNSTEIGGWIEITPCENLCIFLGHLIGTPWLHL